MRLDFDHIRALGRNCIRVYIPLPEWLLDEALNCDLRVFIDVPWEKRFNVKGRMRLDSHSPPPNPIDHQSVLDGCPTEFSPSEFYELLKGGGLEYGPEFRTVESISLGEGECVFEIRGAQPGTDAAESLLPPPVLDACFQVPAVAIRVPSLYLPVALGKLTFYSTPGQRVWCHARQTNRTDRSIAFDMRLFDEFGNITVEMIGAKWQSVGQLSHVFSEPTEEFLSRYRWRQRDVQENGASRGPEACVPSTTSLADVLHVKLERLSRELDRDEHYAYVSPELNELALALVLRALSRLGFEWEPGRSVTETSLMDELNLPRFCRPLLVRVIDFLQSAGALSPSEEGWLIGTVPQLKPPEQHWRELLHRRPGYIAELTLIQRYGSGLPDLLRDHVDELDLLFPDDITTTVDHLLQDAPTSRLSTILLQEALASAVKDNSDGRTVRILEIGSGSGRTGGSVQPHVLGARSHYVIASTSEESEGSRAPQGRNATVAFVNVDVQEEFSEQGLADSTFDVMLLPDGLNACRFQPAVLERIRRLLAPGGLLILREATGLPAWMKLMLAPVLKPSATDGDDDQPIIIPAPAALLRDAGFSDIRPVAERAEQSEFTIFLARNNEREPEEETVPITGESVVEGQDDPAQWLIFSDASEVCVALTHELQARGHSPIVVEPGSAFAQVGETRFRIRPDACEDMKRLIETIRGCEQPRLRIAHLWSLSAPKCRPMTAACLEQAQVPGCISVLHLVQALAEAGGKDLPTLKLVTRGAQSVENIMAESPASTPLWGLARVLMNEHAAFQTGLIDLDPEPDPHEVALLLGELRNGDAEDEVAFRSGIRYVHRLEPISQSEFAATESPSSAESADANYGVRVEIGTPGILDSLKFTPAVREKPGPHQVEIAVQAAALNFKDVAKAMGLLGDASLEGTASGRTLGLECSGTITAVGEDVTDFRVGDEVFGFARQALGSHALADARLVDRLPEHLNHEEAATLVTVAMTAHYALNYLARVTRGDRVLIHAAAGGVGLAAIQLAQSAGAEIIATAGNPEKRGLLHALGVPHVLDSRSVAFADEVMQLTGGRGVDVVLNSLSGEMLTRSFGVLAPFGRFIEIGKRDIEQNNKLGLRPFQNNLSFFAADLDRLCVDKPEIAAKVCGDVMQMIRNKTLFPLPHRVFPASRIVEAFRYMTKAKHIGKIVISMNGARDLAPKPEHPLELRSDATYLVTGGLSGFGLATAQWLAERGARHLALVGRSGASTEEARRAVASLTADGVSVVTAKVDVTDEDAVRTLLDDIGASLPPLRGIIHCAMVLDDSILNNLTAERLWRVLAPKVVGAWNLHTMTLEADLDFFVMYSSLASLIGNPGQGNYAAANAFLDELCHYRRALGLPALTVNWGAIADVGVVARSTDVQEHFQRLGITPLPPQRGLDILGQLIRRDLTQSAVTPPADLGRWIQFFPAGRAPRFSRIAAGSSIAGDGLAGSDGDDIRSLLLAAEEEQRYEVLEHHLRRTLAAVLGASPDKLDVEQPLIDMGIDSLMTVEIVTLIRSQLGVEVPPVKFMEGISLAGLSRHIVDELLPRNAPSESGMSS